MGQDRQHTEHGNERKQQLLEAAQRLFGSRGYARTRIADICAEAGVAKGLFYWYFPTKESLFVELVHSMRLQLRRAQAAAMHDGADPITRIRQGTEASIRFILENQRDIERLIVEAQREGVMPDVDAHFAAVGVVGAVSSFGYATRHGRLTMQEDQLAHLVGDWVMQALTAPAVLPDLGRGGSSRRRDGHFRVPIGIDRYLVLTSIAPWP